MDDIWRITGDVQEQEIQVLLQRSKLAEARVNRWRELGTVGSFVLVALLVVTTIAIERDTRKRRQAEEALRDSEEQFRQVFDESPSGILLIEEDLRIRRANPAFCRLLGYDNSELRQLTLPAILPQDSASDVTRSRVDQRYRTKSGEAVWVNVNETVIRNSQGGVMYNLALVEDRTARRKADQEILAMKGSLERSVEQRTAELAETNRRLESSNKELESFSYSISHDLQAPLRILNGHSAILLEDYGNSLDDEAKRLLGSLQRNTRKMNDLIKDLLKFSKSGRQEVEKSEIDTVKLVNTIILELETSTPPKATIILSPLLPVYADYSLVTQVWINLISNAIKYSAKNENPKIEIGSIQYENEIVHYVKDNGAGFDMKYANKLFGVFQRLHTATEFEGSGVGLAIVKRIISKHGGRVWAESKPNEGATFYFSLPVCESLVLSS